MNLAHLPLLTLPLFTGFPPPPALTTVKPMFYSEIVAKSDQIVIGKVTRSTSRYEHGKQTIRTYVTLANLTIKKGPSVQTLTLRFEGGQIGGDHLAVAAMPKLKVGSRYLLFVRGNGKHISPITGFYQGCFEIVKRGSREVMLNTDGLELTSVKKDRFVFAPKPGPKVEAATAPPVGPGNFTVKPADPDVDAKERDMVRRARERAQSRRALNPLHEVAGSRRDHEHADRPPAEGKDDQPTRGLWRGRDPLEAVPTVLQRDTGIRLTSSDMLKMAKREMR